MNSMLEFFQALVQANIPELGYRKLVSIFCQSVQKQQLHKHAYHSLAKCAAALTIAWDEEAHAVVEELLSNVEYPMSDDRHIFALLVIGEMGRHM